jgi:hypothetical protein
VCIYVFTKRVYSIPLFIAFDAILRGQVFLATINATCFPGLFEFHFFLFFFLFGYLYPELHR